MTGKAFIPFHYSGGDDMRMAAHYKGVGVITFGNDSSVHFRIQRGRHPL